MKTKHTPGPWQIAECGDRHTAFAVADENHISLFTVVNEGKTPFAGVYEKADAQLIATAPELLEELKKLVSDLGELMRQSTGVAGLHLNGDVAVWDSIQPGGQNGPWIDLDSAREAIRKAEGGEV